MQNDPLLRLESQHLENQIKAHIAISSKKRALEKRYEGLAAQTRQAVLDLVPVFFAVVIGVIAFLSNNYVASIVELNFADVLILFGLGAGTSSIKGLLDRS